MTEGVGACTLLGTHFVLHRLIKDPSFSHKVLHPPVTIKLHHDQTQIIFSDSFQKTISNNIESMFLFQINHLNLQVIMLIPFWIECILHSICRMTLPRSINHHLSKWIRKPCGGWGEKREGLKNILTRRLII